MPRLFEIESLVKLCTSCIKNAVENSKFAADPSAFKRADRDAISANNELISDPFHQLPTALLEDIVRSFTSSRKLIDAKILEHFITPHLTILIFTLYSDGILSLFPKLGNLLILNLENTKVGDHCLKSIGTYCSQLRSLNLQICFHVTDQGIQWLCDPGMTNEKSKLCKTITKLNLLYTSVTQKGNQVALTNFLSLKIFKNFHTVEALVEMAQSAIDFKPPKINGFSVFTLYTSPNALYRSNSLQLALSLCQSLHNVSIHVTKGLKDSDLLCLMSMKMLSKLRIRKSDFWIPSDTEITFDGGVAPLLRLFGRSLQTLELECLNLVRISIIIKCCPNLIALYISGVTGLLENEKDTFQFEKKPPIFKELKMLYCTRGIPEDILLFLLSSPLLEYVVICYCDALTDEVLLETVECHQFKNLKNFELLSCDSVTKRSIDALLINGCNPLEILKLYCKNLSSENLADWLSLIAKKNWNLKISIK